MKSFPDPPSIEDTELVLEEVLRHTPVGVVLSDLHGTIIDVNDAMCAMIGYDRAELVGSVLTRFSHADDLCDIQQRTDDLREGRTGHYTVQRRYVARDGRIVHTKVAVSIVRSRTGEPVCGIGIVENVTDRVAIEEALRRSEMRYRRIVEDQTELIVRCLPDGTRTFVNEAYCRYNSTSAEEMLGTSFFTCMDEEEQKLVRAKFAALSPQNPVITDQHWVIGPQGDLRWHEWTDRGFFDAEGKLVEVQSVGRDLTEQHAAQQLLVESEERYRRLFNSLPVAVWENDWSEVMSEIARRGLDSPEKFVAAVTADPSIYYDLGTKVRITAANQAALDMAGVGTLEQFEAWLGGAATRESAVRWSATVPDLMFGSSNFIMGEYTLIRANGEPIDLLIRIARSNRWGEDFMTFPIAVDVSDRKRIERELQHKQEVTDRAEAAAQIGTWEWNVNQDLVYGSPGFWRIIDGCEDGGPSQRPMAAVLSRMHPEDEAAVGERWRNFRAPSTGERPPILENDYRLVRNDGSIAVAHGQNFGSYGPDGALVRVVGILRDITDAHRAEQEAARHRDELVRADKMISLGLLVSGMAHEINNPNHSIGLNVPLLRNAWRDAATLLDELHEARGDLRIGRMPWAEARQEVAAMLSDIEHASERIRNIVSELRGFALDHASAERRGVSVNDIVEASLRLLGKHIARATRDFRVDAAPDVPLVAGNAHRLEQVVVNLVINACQALSGEGQAIRIETGCDAGRVFIRVRDEGRGIAPADLPNIRRPFFTTKRAEGGTGLGLAVSDRIAAEHGGELTFESQPGRGTTATLWLPRVTP